MKTGITGGESAPGDRLPGVRDIADEWNTSPNTVLKALAALEEDGLIRKRRGQGIFVNEKGEWAGGVGDSGDLGIIIGAVDDPFNLRLLGAVEKTAASRGYKLAVGSSADSVPSVLSGLIVVPASANDAEQMLIPMSEVPVIYTGRFCPSMGFGGHYVISDLYSGVFYAAGMLLESGRQRIAYIGGGGYAASDPGKAAVSDVLAGTKFGFRREYAVSAGGYDADYGRRAMENLLLNDEFPDAVICSTDTLAAGAVKVCRSAGLAVPSDVSIIGTGDQEIAPLLDPPLTSLRVQAELLGSMTAGFMDELIRGGIDSGGTIRSRLDPELIIRGSALSAAADAGGAELIGADGITEASDDEGLWL